MKIRGIGFGRGMGPALLVGWLVLMAPAPADTYPRQHGIKITNFTFDITLNDANNEFVVQETVQVRFLAAGVTGVDLEYTRGQRLSRTRPLA